MNKDVSIRYTGDTKDFQKAADRVNVTVRKQADMINAKNTEMEGGFDKATGAAIAMIAVFAVSTVANFFKSSIKLASDFAKAGGELSSTAKNTLGRLEDMSLEWEAIKINIGESILEGNGFFKIIDGIGKRLEEIRKKGFLGALFGGKQFDKTLAEKELYDVDRYGNPLPKTGRRTLTEIKAQLKAAKELADAEKRRAKAAAEVAAAAAKELAIREKLGKEYEKLFMKVNMPESFEAWGKAQQKNPGKLAGPPVSPIQGMTDGLEAQINLIKGLQSAFEGMASAAMKGGNVLKSMADSMVESIKRIAAELLAKAAIWAILRVIFPGLFGTLKIGSFGKFVSGGLIGGAKVGSNIGMSAQNIKIGGEFRLKGSDAYAMVQRYGSVLGGAT